MSLYSSLTQVLAPFAAKINGLLTGWDGTRYSTPGEAVRQQISNLHVLIGDVPGTAIASSAVSYDGTSSDLSATNVQAAVDETNEKVAAVNGRLGNVEPIVSAVTSLGTQLFDKNNAWTEHWVFTNDGVISDGSNTTSVIIPVSPSAADEYITVHRDTISSRFTVATFSDKPQVGSSPVEYIKDNAAPVITIDCSTSIKYIMVVLHNATSDTSITVQTMLNGLMVQYGTIYTGYEPYTFRAIISERSVSGDSFNADAVNYISNLVGDLTKNEKTLTDANKGNSLTVSDITLSWTDGSYYDYLNTGELKTLSGRAYTSKMDCKPGDRISVTNNKGQIVFWTDNNVFISYGSTSQTATKVFVVPLNAAKYALNNSDSTIKASTITQYVNIAGLQERRYTAPAKTMYDSSDFVSDKYCSTDNGKISTLANWYCLPFVTVESNHKYRTPNQMQVVFYDASLGFISAHIPGGEAANTGTSVEMDFTTPSECKYISINTKSAVRMLFDLDYTVTGRIDNPKKLQGKKVLSFGDSITGNYGFGDNYPYQIEEITGAKTYNCGFGGCRMELLEESGSAAETAVITNPFAMCAIVDELAKNDDDTTKWAAQDEAAATFEASPRFNRIIKFRLDILKTIDITEIDIVTIAYGTNEAGYPQDDENDKYNKYTYAGATRYSIEKLLELNPKLSIVLLTPIYRHSFGSGEGDSDSFVRPSTGLGLLDNIDTLKAVGLEYKVPAIDMYHDLGINKENYLSYFGDDDEPDDGTHINSFGRERMGRRIAGELCRLF